MTKYKEAVAWIALNDEPGETGEIIVEEMITVALVADLFKKTTAKVASDVVKYREGLNAVVKNFGHNEPA